MQNQTDMVGVSILDKLKQFLHNKQQWTSMLAVAAAGYVMSNSFLLGGVAPFGVAFCAALNGRYVYFASLGAILGYIFSLGEISSVKYIAATLLVAVLKWFVEPRSKRFAPVLVTLGTSFVAMGVASAIIVFTMDYTIYNLMLAAAELMLCCAAAYFFARTVSSLDMGFEGASRSDISCIIVSFAIVIMGFSAITIGGLSIGRIVSIFVVLVCARYGNESAGAISGIVAGIAMGLSGNDYSYAVAAYAFGGLVSGIFSRIGRVATAVSFIAVNVLTIIFVSGSIDVYTAVFEIFAASVIFLALPSSWIKRLHLDALRGSKDAGEASQAVLRQRMDRVSQTLLEISQATRQVSGKLGKLEKPELESLHSQVAEKVCRYCGMRTTCWQFRYNETAKALDECTTILRREGVLTRERAPTRLSRDCCKLDSLLSELNILFQQQVSRQGVQRKVSRVRSVVTDQFEGMSMMLGELSDEICNLSLLEFGRTNRVLEYMEKEGFSASSTYCYADEFSRVHVDLTIPTWQLVRLNRAKMVLDLGALLEVDFDVPQITSGEKKTTLTFSEKASYTLKIGAHQISSNGNRLCGDSYDILRNRGGNSHIILSDGMGSGGAAAVDSSMAAGLISRLLSVGVGHEAALKMVNSALLIKSGEESLATIDICSLNLFTGKAEFYKAGAAPTFVLRGNKVGYVESTSLPAGILRGVSFEKSGLSLHAGDIVVMVSDGVVATGSEWVVSELESLRGCDVKTLSKKVAVTAQHRRIDNHEDDITVIACLLDKGV